MRQAALARDKRADRVLRHPGRTASPGPAKAPRLLTAEPLLKLVRELTRMGDDRRRLTPSDPVASAVDNIVLMLENSIAEASDFGTLVDVDTAAEILGLSPSMVRVHCKKGLAAGGLDAQKFGGEWRITRASIEARLGMER